MILVRKLRQAGVLPLSTSDPIMASMKRLTVLALYLALMVATTGPVAARYDCRVMGVKGQASCCCQGKDSGSVRQDSAESPAPAAAQCSCCDVKYFDDPPSVAAADRTSSPKSEAAPEAAAPFAEVRESSFSTLHAPGRVAVFDGANPNSEQTDRHILYCSLLC